MSSLLAVFIGGGIGSLARYGISKMILGNSFLSLPVATISANILSCIVLGLVVGVFREKVISGSFVWLLVVVGFCGGFSTFSTFSLETLELFKAGNYISTLLNVLISLFSCLIILYLLTRHHIS